MWLAANALAMLIVGVMFLFFPERVRSLLFPDWRRQIMRSPMTGMSLLVFRLVGVGALIGALLSLVALTASRA